MPLVSATCVRGWVSKEKRTLCEVRPVDERLAYGFKACPPWEGQIRVIVSLQLRENPVRGKKNLRFC